MRRDLEVQEFCNRRRRLAVVIFILRRTSYSLALARSSSSLSLAAPPARLYAP